MNGNSAAVKGSGAEVKNSKITITKAGVYVVSGKLDNGQIIVDVQDKGTVRLVLNGVQINCADNAPIYLKNAGKTIISLQEGTENIISDGTKYVLSDASTDEPNAAIFSKDNLTINGTGKLTVYGNYNNGITSKDDLKITGGNIRIYSADDGIMGRDIVAVKEGSITVESKGDAIKSTNDTDTTSNNRLNINGGYLAVNSMGDGLDANGSIYMTKGTVVVSGPTANNNGALDYDGTFEMTGGFLIAAGSSGMAQAPSEQSTQNSIIMTYPQTQQAGTIVNLKDSKGNTLATFAPKKNYQTVVISSPELKKNSVYTLYSGGSSSGNENDGLYTDGEYKNGTKIVDFTISNSVTWLNESGVTTSRSSHPGTGRTGGPNNPEFGGNQNRLEKGRPSY